MLIEWVLQAVGLAAQLGKIAIVFTVRTVLVEGLQGLIQVASRLDLGGRLYIGEGLVFLAFEVLAVGAGWCWYTHQPVRAAAANTATINKSSTMATPD